MNQKQLWWLLIGIEGEIRFDQDTGGAIKGSGRVDLFYGEGDTAAQKAGVMKQKGKIILSGASLIKHKNFYASVKYS